MSTKLAYEGDPNQLAQPIPVLGLGACEKLDLTTTADRTTAVIADGTTCVRVAWSVPCHIVIAPGTPSATTSDTFLPGTGWDHFKVSAGDRISLIKGDGESDGFATVTVSA